MRLKEHVPRCDVRLEHVSVRQLGEAQHCRLLQSGDSFWNDLLLMGHLDPGDQSYLLRKCVSDKSNHHELGRLRE